MYCRAPVGAMGGGTEGGKDVDGVPGGGYAVESMGGGSG